MSSDHHRASTLVPCHAHAWQGLPYHLLLERARRILRATAATSSGYGAWASQAERYIRVARTPVSAARARALRRLPPVRLPRSLRAEMAAALGAYPCHERRLPVPREGDGRAAGARARARASGVVARRVKIAGTGCENRAMGAAATLPGDRTGGLLRPDRKQSFLAFQICGARLTPPAAGPPPHRQHARAGEYQRTAAGVSRGVPSTAAPPEIIGRRHGVPRRARRADA